jgi:RNA polymerase sigma-70 factor (ECF subfamily)
MKNYKSFKRDAKRNAGQTASREETIGKLIDENQERAYAFAYNLAKGSDEARDLVQEANFRVLRSWNQYDPLRSFTAWYLTIIRNAFLDERESAGKIRTVPLCGFVEEGGGMSPADFLADGEMSAEERLEKEETARETREVLKALQKPHRDILTLCDIEGRNYAEAAKITGVSIGTIKSRLNRARKAFRRRI